MERERERGRGRMGGWSRDSGKEREGRATRGQRGTTGETDRKGRRVIVKAQRKKRGRVDEDVDTMFRV